MNTSNKSYKENGEIIQSILMVSMFAIITTIVIGVVSSALTLTATSEKMLSVAQKVEKWSIANPVDAAHLTTGDMSYFDLVTKTDSLEVVGDELVEYGSNKVQYIEKGEGNYELCVAFSAERDDTEFFVYSTISNDVETKESCQ